MTLDPRNPMMSALRATLVFEIIVVWLSLAGMLQLADAPVGLAVGACAAVTVLAVVALAGLKKGWGFPVAWLTQAAMIALGVLTPWMYAMGVIFAIIWAASVILGKKIEAKKKESQ